MNTMKIEINGKQVEAREGQTILEVVEELGLDNIPTLCHSPELKPYGSCFVCVVEVEGRPNLVPSCATVISDGMKIDTKSERVLRSRKAALELLLSNHYADCVAPCSMACPAGVDVQGYIALAAMGEYRKAVDLVRETNPLPAICGRVCVRFCEAVCRRVDIDEPVGINYIKRYVADFPGAYSMPPQRKPVTGKSVGVVGAGPAGLTAAWFLGKEGHDVTIYEQMEEAGGMLRYGIPAYRLPRDVIDREIDFIKRVGVDIRCGVKVGKDIKLDEIMDQHDAVFLVPGAIKGKPMRLEHEFDTDGVLFGIDFLIEKANKRDSVSGVVVVVGGGNTAMDVARTSWRLGADKVIILYRRTKAEMPADEFEIEDCIKEGIEIVELAAPVGIVRDGKKLKALKCIRMKLGEKDKSGRCRPVPLEGSEFDLPCNLAISAIGQSPLLDEIVDGSKSSPELSKWSTLVVDTKTMQTNIEGLFAGGDAADDGPTVVVDAIRDGRRAAKAIQSYLLNDDLPADQFRVSKEFWDKPGEAELGDIEQSQRHRMNEISVEDRVGNFDEVATGYEYDDVVQETGRCLSCGCVAFDECKLRKYAEEYDVDMERFKGYARKHKVDERHPYIVYDPNKCVLCSRCIRTCERVLPVGALGLMDRGFQTEMRPAMNEPLLETSCVACGNCVDACPTGALSVKFPFEGRACLGAESVETRCGFCSVGCRIRVKSFGGGRYWIEPSGEPGDYLCFYGRFSNGLFINRKRLVAPMVREGMKHKKVSYEDAYERIASDLKKAVEDYGPEAVAVFVSPELSNEEMYIASRIAREGLRTNNIASLSSILAGVKSGALDESFGFTASTASRECLSDADLIICNNIDTQNDQLVFNADIIESVKRGAKLVLCTSSEVGLKTLSTVSLDPMCGRASLLWNGVIRQLISENFFDRELIAGMPGGKAYLDDDTDYSIARTVELSGVDEERIEAAVKLIKNSTRIVIAHGPDRTRDQSSGDIAVFANLTLLLRAKGLTADMLLPSMAANSAGIELSGADPKFLPGKMLSKGIVGASSREDLLEILRSKTIKAALIIGEDPFCHDRTASYFSAVEYVAVVDWAHTETASLANISVPGSTYLESEGTRCNFEGRVLRYEASVDAPDGIKNWHVLSNIASNLGVDVPAAFAQITKELENRVRENQSDYLSRYWNLGESVRWDGRGKLVVADTGTAPVDMAPSLTAIDHYKQEVDAVGVERLRYGFSRKRS